MAENENTAAQSAAAAFSTPLPQDQPLDQPVAAPSGHPQMDDALKSSAMAEQSETAQLEALGADIRGQDDLEQAVGQQADKMLLEQADERDTKRIEKTLTAKGKLDGQLRALKDRQRTNPHVRNIETDIRDIESKIFTLDNDLKEIQQRIAERHQDKNSTEDVATTTEQKGNKRRPGESRREFLIRTGKITPFSKIGQDEIRVSSNLADVMMDAEAATDDEEDAASEEEDLPATAAGPKSHINLLKPGFADDASSAADSAAEAVKMRPRKKRRLYADPANEPSDDASDAEFTTKQEEDFGDSEEESETFANATEITAIGRKRKSGKTTMSAADSGAEDLAGIDDGKESLYQARLDRWVTGRQEARARVEARRKADAGEEPTVQEEQVKTEDADAGLPSIEDQEWHKPHPSRPDADLGNGFRVPGDIFPSLFDYQKTGVQWLWELYQQKVGGIVGDEMGLGKTIQVISFLAGLHYSGKYDKPIIIVCPATVMKQWVNEFHTWWPPFRVSILHTSGSGMMNVKREAEFDDELDMLDNFDKPKRHGTTNKAAKKVVDRVINEGHVLVTTYAGLQSYGDLLVNQPWGYAVLDEGHKIRNPNSQVAIFCKCLDTHHRIITSGTPIQNNLIELWSLFDFVFPMRLGNLVTFRRNFEVPIREGGYANASNLQVQTAYNCAEALKEAISPYLLQRWKSDVAQDLPTKSEQVLFCKLSPLQLEMYGRFTKSKEKDEIMDGKRHALWGIDILRKICNHPDLVDHKVLAQKSDYAYGAAEKSGKMAVVKMLLQLWSQEGHKTLLFAQHRIMLDILDKLLAHMPGINYARMDGSTPIKQRQNMIDDFNNNPNIDVFLLTTKVGGLGVNLTSADRVIIYDPDWNPSTDLQARERAWRLGQKREVMIYRLMMAGTIEEKIYHRQLFKQFLTNKILKDPKQRQTFHLQGLSDLFTLNDPRMQNDKTETGALFEGVENRLSPQADGGKATSSEAAAAETERIRKIDGIASAEAFTSSEEHSKSTNGAPLDSEAGPAANGDTPKKLPQNHLLDSLLQQSGVSTTLNHDAILGSNNTHGRDPVTGKVLADPATIQREAKRIAAEAANQLKQAGQEARNVPIGTVTWTGQVGDVSRSGSPALRGGVSGRGGASRGGRGGPSSASVLANLQQRQGTQNNDSARRPGDRGDALPQGKDFMAMIRDYIKAHGGKVYSQMLVNHFNRFCTTERRTAEFQHMLRTIARMEKTEGGSSRGSRGGRNGGRAGRAQWVLKEEYA